MPCYVSSHSLNVWICITFITQVDIYIFFIYENKILIRRYEHQLDYRKHKVTPAVTLFFPSLFSLSVCIFPSLTGHKCQAGGAERRGGEV